MKRYSNGGRGSPYECADGQWVKHSDHEAALAAVQAERDAALACEKVQREIAVKYEDRYFNLTAEHDEAMAKAKALQEWWDLNPSLFQHRIAAAEAEAQALRTDAERERLRSAQASAVMPLIGPLLDAWECCSQSVREDHPDLDKHLRRINRAMEDADEVPNAE